MGPPTPAPWSAPGRSRLGLAGDALGGLGAEVWGERELHQLGQQLLDLLGLPHDDALVDDPEDPADDRLLERRRQLLALRRDLAAHAEERHEGLDRALIALDRRRAGGERLDDAGAGEGRLAGDITEEGGERGVDAGRPGVGLAGGVDDAAQRFLDRVLGGGEEAVLLGGEVLVEGVAGDAGATHDVGHGNRAVALFDSLLGEGGDDACALVLGDELAWQWVPYRRSSDRLRNTIGHERQGTQPRLGFQAGRID